MKTRIAGTSRSKQSSPNNIVLVGSEVLTAGSRVVWYKFTDVSEARMMEAASTSETSVNFYQTTRR
jgi:hypothetical protein